MRHRIFAVASMTILAVIAVANDGPVLSVPAGGIQFTKTDAIAMDKEDLFISEDAVRVAYVFRNTTGDDFTTEVAFPLPIYDLGEFEGELPRYAKFSVKVNGKSTEFRTLDRAVICEDPKDKSVPTRGPFTVARDVTDILLKHKLVVADPVNVWDALDKLTPAAQDELIQAGILKRDEEYLVPLWKVQTAYVWEQTFPAQAETRVEHDYVPQIGYFGEWHIDPFYADVLAEKLKVDDVPKFGTAAFNQKASTFLARYDVDDGVQQWAAKQRAAKKRFSFTVVDYILTTAAYWKGPIKDFTLTIEKPESGPVAVTTAIPGLKRLNDRRFELKKADYTPERDLSIVFIHAYDEL